MTGSGRNITPLFKTDSSSNHKNIHQMRTSVRSNECKINREIKGVVRQSDSPHSEDVHKSSF